MNFNYIQDDRIFLYDEYSLWPTNTRMLLFLRGEVGYIFAISQRMHPSVSATYYVDWNSYFLKYVWNSTTCTDHFVLLGHRISDQVVEVLKGIRCYFDKSLPVMLLYKKERKQYQEAVTDDVSPSFIYGGEHLLRLFGMLDPKPWWNQLWL